MQSSVLKRFGIIVAALIPVAVVGAYAFGGRGNDDAPSTATTSSSQTPSTQAASSTTQSTTKPSTTTTFSGSSTSTSSNTSSTTTSSKTTTYKNGTYTATGSYLAPDGTQSILVSLTIANDVVTATTVTPQATQEGSSSWQQYFAANYSASVIGKSLATLSLGNVSGASLTPIGFNAAVTSIRTQAKI